MNHPAGNHIGVGRAAVWYGREVEGELSKSPHPTVFIDSVPHPEQLREIASKLQWNEISHVFLTEDFQDWDWFADVLLPLLEPSVKVTIGTHPKRAEWLLQQDFIARCSLMVRVDMNADWVHKLRFNDQITVGEPYRLTTWRVADGVMTVPSDYTDDQL